MRASLTRTSTDEAEAKEMVKLLKPDVAGNINYKEWVGMVFDYA